MVTVADVTRAVGRPLPYEPSDAAFWDDPYIAGQLLTAHLDQAREAASRPRGVIEETVTSLVARGLAGPGRRVLDLGCGPGLYAQLLAEAGCTVRGVDLSRNSIHHAQARAAESRLSIDYRVQDFLTLEDVHAWDLVLQAYGELSTLPDPVRDDLLRRIRRSLAPHGALVFDVTTPVAHRWEDGARTWEVCHGGLWRAGAHLVLTERLRYGPDLTAEQYVVVDEARGAVVYRMWFHDYTRVTLPPVLEGAGFEVDELWGSLLGQPCQASDQWLAALARPYGWRGLARRGSG